MMLRISRDIWSRERSVHVEVLSRLWLSGDRDVIEGIDFHFFSVTSLALRL